MRLPFVTRGAHRPAQSRCREIADLLSAHPQLQLTLHDVPLPRDVVPPGRWKAGLPEPCPELGDENEAEQLVGV